jgi:hypothetical protein
MIPQLPISTTWLVLVLRVQHRGVQIKVVELVGRVGAATKDSMNSIDLGLLRSIESFRNRAVGICHNGPGASR